MYVLPHFVSTKSRQRIVNRRGVRHKSGYPWPAAFTRLGVARPAVRRLVPKCASLSARSRASRTIRPGGGNTIARPRPRTPSKRLEPTLPEGLQQDLFAGGLRWEKWKNVEKWDRRVFWKCHPRTCSGPSSDPSVSLMEKPGSAAIYWFR